MKQLEMKTITKQISLLALSGAFVVGIAACGGGSSSSTPTTNITGNLSQGPISGAKIFYNGADTGQTSDASGNFTISVPTPTTPVKLTVDPSNLGIDVVTGLVPIFAPSTVVMPGDTNVNANTLTTLITRAAEKASGGLSVANLATASSAVMSNFGFGTSSIENFNPRTQKLSSLSGASALQLALGFESATEMVRRVVVRGNTAELLLEALGTELSDGRLDGSSSDNAVLSLVKEAIIQNNVVMTEVSSTDGLKIGGTNGSSFNSVVGKFSSVTATINDLEFVKLSVKTAADAARVASNEVEKQCATLKGCIVNAGKASNLKTSFLVDTTTGANHISLTDSAGPLTPTVTTPTSGVLMVTLPNVAGSKVNAQNLLDLAGGRGTAVAPVLNFSLTNLPVSSGKATVEMKLLDVGASSTAPDDVRDPGERQIIATYDVVWSSNGTTLTLTASSTAAVSYYTIASTTPTTATLSNAAVGALLVTTAGSNEASQKAKLQLRIKSLFSTGGGDSALATALSQNVAKGSYYYSVSISGLPLADKEGNAFSKIAGTFTAE